MKHTCCECLHFDLRAAGGVYAKLGLGKCIVHSLGRAEFVTAAYARECEKFAAADADTVAKRNAFLGITT